MADIRDGSIRDRTVNESLQVGADIFFIRHAELMDDDTIFTYIFPSSVEGNTVTAGDIKAANISHNIDIIATGQVIDEEDNTYFLQPLNGELVLLLNGSLKKEEINQNG